jgi:hypothetical protein
VYPFVLPVCTSKTLFYSQLLPSWHMRCKIPETHLLGSGFSFLHLSVVPQCKDEWWNSW